MCKRAIERTCVLRFVVRLVIEIVITGLSLQRRIVVMLSRHGASVLSRVVAGLSSGARHAGVMGRARAAVLAWRGDSARDWISGEILRIDYARVVVVVLAEVIAHAELFLKKGDEFVVCKGWQGWRKGEIPETVLIRE